MGRLTTHVLDTAQGRPGDGIKVELYYLAGHRQLISTTFTNDDGRCDAPLAQGGAFEPGDYELVFYAGDYFDAQGLELPTPKFLDEVVLRFGVSDASQHYHVPLLLSPFGYSTYRGS